MTVVDAATRRYLSDYARLKAMWKCSDADMAERLGCNPGTIAHMKKSPMSVSGEVILKVQEYLRRELRKLDE